MAVRPVRRASKGHSNTNERGSSAQRRIRKQWLLDKFGDGTVAPCWEDGCDTEVDFETIYVDRITPAHEGGTYRRDNIRVHCQYHSCRQGALMRADLRLRDAERIMA